MLVRKGRALRWYFTVKVDYITGIGYFAIVKSRRNEAVKFLRKSMIECGMD